MSKAQMFISRLPTDAPSNVASDIETTFGIVDNFVGKIATIRADKNLTRAGQQTAIEKALGSGVLGHLGQLRANAEKRLSDAVGQREVLRQRVLTGQNYDAMQKSEARQIMARMTDEQRIAIIREGEPLFIEAILNAPAALSGLTRELWGHVAAKALEDAHGEHLKQIDVLEGAYSEALTAMQVAADDIRRAAEMTEGDFAKVAA